MPGRPRMPEAVAEATGAYVKNPKRAHGRSTPKVGDLGPAPPHLDSEECEAWAMCAAEMPWLGASDRVAVEVVAKLRARLKAGTLALSMYSELRQCLNALGATPASRSKVMAPPDDEEDPAEAYFN